MKALIFNSGMGSRLGELTADKPKSMVRLANGETIFHRQLRILHACGIRDFVVTTGPYPEQLAAEAAQFCEAGCIVAFVENPVYDRTNYIYSMYLARDLLVDDDFITLHGDLVFDAGYAQKVIDSELPSLGSVNQALPHPEKDFKSCVIDGEVREVSVSIFDGDCVAFQPFYKLSQDAMAIWLDSVERFVNAGKTGVYAENAANEVFEQLHVAAFSYEGHFVEEVDTPEDLAQVSMGIRLFDFAQQPVFCVNGSDVKLVEGMACSCLYDAHDVAAVLRSFGVRRPLVVTAPFFPSLNIASILESAGIDYVTFTDFEPNPTYQDAMHALHTYVEADCDSILSVGGGSAIDIAKCVKQLLAMPDTRTAEDIKSPNLPYSPIVHIAVPTTAGTGSESTHFAVCYVDGTKVSVANDCLQPNAVLLDAANLASLPDYQRKCTLLDALCQAIESYWSGRSSHESREYSRKSIKAIVADHEAYLEGDEEAAESLMRAANRAGKAINLTTTTAPHAMSYKLTSLYHIPHGHAVALCMPHCWRYLIDSGDTGIVSRLVEIARLMKGENTCEATDGLDAFCDIYEMFDMPESWKPGNIDDLDTLVESVNLQRLSNFPVEMRAVDVRKIYLRILQ